MFYGLVFEMSTSRFSPEKFKYPPGLDKIVHFGQLYLHIFKTNNKYDSSVLLVFNL